MRRLARSLAADSGSDASLDSVLAYEPVRLSLSDSLAGGRREQQSPDSLGEPPVGGRGVRAPAPAAARARGATTPEPRSRVPNPEPMSVLARAVRTSSESSVSDGAPPALAPAPPPLRAPVTMAFRAPVSEAPVDGRRRHGVRVPADVVVASQAAGAAPAGPGARGAGDAGVQPTSVEGTGPGQRTVPRAVEVHGGDNKQHSGLRKHDSHGRGGTGAAAPASGKRHNLDHKSVMEV